MTMAIESRRAPALTHRVQRSHARKHCDRHLNG
jgi:hypothetical protein